MFVSDAQSKNHRDRQILATSAVGVDFMFTVTWTFVPSLFMGVSPEQTE
jgi:hypothetical protein